MSGSKSVLAVAGRMWAFTRCGMMGVHTGQDDGQSSEMGLYEVPWDISFPCLRIRITIDAFQMVVIRVVDTEL